MIKNERINHVEVLHENFDGEGKLKSVMVVAQSTDKLSYNFVLIPKWLLVLMVLGLIAITIILISALCVVYYSPRPGLYGENCDRRSCTKGLNLQCINHTCQCTFDQFYAKGCQEKKSYLEKCNSDSKRCKTNTNTVCLDGVCKCNEKYYWNGTTCKLKNSYGQKCYNDESCFESQMLFCNSTTGKCSCNDTRFWDGTVCYPKRTYNEKCYDDTQCINSKFLICKNGSCSCDSLYYFDLTYSLCRTRLNEFETCISSYQCHVPMNCTNSLCQCGQYEYHDNTTFSCYPQKSINETCSVTHNCRSDKGLACRLNTCQCVDSTPIWSTYRDKCILQMTYTDACQYPNDCNPNKFLVCITGTNCNCPTATSSTVCDCTKTINNEYFWNGTSCQNALDFGKTCSGLSTSYMCQTLTQGTICSTNGSSYSCQCPTLQYFNVTTKKCENQLLGYEKCILTTDCRIDLGLYCNTGSCSCNSTNQFWNGTVCVNYYTYMDACTNSSECASSLYCASGSSSNCSCPTYFSTGSKCDCHRSSGNENYWNSSTSMCVPAVSFGGLCSATYMCKTIEQLTTCNSGVCSCGSYGVYNSTLGKCQFCKGSGMFVNGYCYKVSTTTLTMSFNISTSSNIVTACDNETTARLAILSDSTFSLILNTSFAPIASIYVNAFKISNNYYVSNDGTWIVSNSEHCAQQPANQFCIILSKTTATTWCYTVEQCNNAHYVFCEYDLT